jgi:translocation and assembly module TamA
VLGGNGGCALLTPGTDPADPVAAEPAAPPAVVIDIDAPDELKTLLERYLDLSRLGTLGRGRALSDTELTRLIDATPAEVRALLETEGYFAPEVSIVREPPASVPARSAEVEAGPARSSARRRRSRNALASGRCGDPLAQKTLDELRSRWPMKPGTPFRNPAWASAKNSSLAQLRAAGYASATWSGTAVDIDAAEHRARLFVVADSGPLFRSGDIDVDGLAMHDRETVLNLADFRRGTPVTETLLLDFQDRMVKAGLFETVSITVDLDPEKADAARILVRVTELSRHQLTVGIGYSDSSGARVTLEHVCRLSARPPAQQVRDRRDPADLGWRTQRPPRHGLYRNLIGGSVET